MSARRRNKHDGSWWEAPWLAGLLLLALAAYVALSLREPVGPWWHEIEGRAAGPLIAPGHPGGPVGAMISLALNVVLGAIWCWAVPLGLAISGLAGLAGRPLVRRAWLWRVAVLWLVSSAWLAQPDGPLAGEGAGARWGGLVAALAARGIHSLVGFWGGRIFLTLALLVVLMAVFHRWLAPVGRRLVRLADQLAEAGRRAGALGRRGTAHTLRSVAAVSGYLSTRLRSAARGRRGSPAAARREPERDDDIAGPRPRRVHTPDEDLAETEGFPAAGLRTGARSAPADPAPAPRPVAIAAPPQRSRRRAGEAPAPLPGLHLLADPDPAEERLHPAELDTAADLLEETLRSFGVSGEVKDVRPGPVVTTFEYQPGPGIRVSQIVQRADDLSLAMRARSLRMEAPIPGKAAVGIEIPNPRPQIVRLKEVLEQVEGEPRTPLTVVLGKDVIGQPVSIDLAALPHLLVAGSTGSGKSVCLNALICNLLLFNDPKRLRLLMVDPKMLELNVYNGIPHLLLPVVTDPREALKALRWLVAQMDLRYRLLARHSVRNIEQYNDRVERGDVRDAEDEPVTDPMPYYVCIVDELADLMIQLGQDFEQPVTRLAQKARAVGIHLVLATQRPSVDVLTGVIKANIPCRVAFRVIQKNDSRTILDMNGAEQLLGRGDMLYLKPGRAQPQRVHGAFVEIAEAEAVASHWREYVEATDTIDLDEGASGPDGVRGEDDLFDEAVRVVVLHQSGSTSLLQRRLRIGYTRAGRLMDMLEEAGVVGPFTGSKARDVLIEPGDLPEPSDPGEVRP
ncbi:MAG: DNA translocase FtsK [Candidatus Krumholzibacteriia bacterium]